jgi:hypothetical protein
MLGNISYTLMHLQWKYGRDLWGSYVFVKGSGFPLNYVTFNMEYSNWGIVVPCNQI